MLRNKRNGKCLVFLLACVATLIPFGCSDATSEMSERSDTTITQINDKSEASDGNRYADAETIEEILSDIYDEAVSENALGSLATRKRMVARLGERGYAAVDSENQIDMTCAEQVLEFCGAVEKKENAEITIIVVTDSGCRKFDLQTEEGNVTIVREYDQYDGQGQLQNKSTVSYPADFWQYTEEGYLIFEGSSFSEESFVLTLSDETEHTALRVLPLNETCREMNRKYIQLVGYKQNNMFLTDWSEADFGSLDFYDVFDRFYPIVNKQPNPYVINDGVGTDSVCEVPEALFETVVTAHVKIDSETLRKKTAYLSENAVYEYRPRGFYEAEYPEIPYPEVVGYTENGDGTITLIVNAVYPKENTSKSFSHKTVIRPLDGGGFQYVSNEIISPKEDGGFWWHSERPADEEGKAESDLWMLPQAEDCLLTAAEQEALNEKALTAAEQVKEVYKDVEITGESSFGSNIEGFTEKQRREAVSLLGRAGYVSVTDDVNMENYEKVEEFYTAYRENRDAEVTLYNVDRDGLIGAITFLCRGGKLQTYYVGIGWRKGGVPELKSASVSNIAEMKLTEKGYLIYAYENVMPHSSLRQYWRIKPLSDQCRELTAKYVHGLSYVNYNVLVTNWDSGNAEDILMPCMFEDIYRIDTGENLKPQNGRIPAATYERIMTTYFPVSVEQLREKCGYDEKSHSYAYDMIFSRQYPPFGEVVGYMENGDGTITLIVDAVWADYNSDLAFTNRIVVQPFGDGTFRYLSNSIEEKEMEVPKVDESGKAK